MRRLLLPAFLCVLAFPAVSRPPLDLDADEARSRPDAELASGLQLLARAWLLSASTGGLAREGPALSVEAGPRRGGGSTTADLAAGLELPVVLDRGPARRASEALRAGAAAIEAAARLEARQRLRTAFAEACLAAERAALLDEQARLGEEWLRVTTRRIGEGAEAPYHARLVEGDLLRVRAERADLPAAPAPLLPPPVAVPAVPRDAPDRFAKGVLAAGLSARGALEEASLELERSLARERWSLAKEGDEKVARAGLAYRFPLAGEPATGVPLASIRGLTLIPVPEPQAEGAYFPGKAIGDEGAEAVLSSPVAGVVAGTPHPPGRAVRAGAPLVSIASPELAELKAR